MKVGNNGKFIDMHIGQKVLVAHCGSGCTYFGEFGTLVRTTGRHMVLVTESGAAVKTAIDNIHHVVGKAKNEGYFVSVNVDGRENDPHFIHQNVRFWNSNKCCFENK